MAALALRWSEQEARKSYARPFMVMFLGDAGELLGSVALNGADLLYQRQFEVAVAALGGELYTSGELDQSTDPQRAWLDHLSALLPAAAVEMITPRSTFDAERGRVFGFHVRCSAEPAPVVDARTLLDYQEFQAAVAHQAGRLFRVPSLEAVEQPLAQRRAWDGWLRNHVERPGSDDAMAETWPWR